MSPTRRAGPLGVCRELDLIAVPSLDGDGLIFAIVAVEIEGRIGQ